MPEPIRAVLIGAGQRGALDYAPYALQHPDEMKFVGVAEPNPHRRQQFAKAHAISAEDQFETWEELLDKPQMAEAALICTQDQMHTAPAIKALHKGYHVLLEKPMATTARDCNEIHRISQETERQLHICHVLRYTEHFQKLREIIQSEVLGQIIHVSHQENVSWWHMAHSYVRGHWAIESESCPMILAKCCHDFDILMWALGQRCLRISSTGNLIHFCPENAPEGAPEYCLDGCPIQSTCPYDAHFIYVDLIPLWRTIEATSNGIARWVMKAQLRTPGLIRIAGKIIPLLRQVRDYRGWPRSVITQDPSPERLLENLRSGPYGKCVYRCNNDVVDHQVVMMEFEDGISVTLTMHGHAHIEGRRTQIEGSVGSLRASFSLGGSWIEVLNHRSGRITRYNTSRGLPSGHSGGDEGLMRSFVRSLREQEKEKAAIVAEQAMESHLLAFAAEEARRTENRINIEEYSSSYSLGQIHSGQR
jgi:predicted dehydrogenase